MQLPRDRAHFLVQQALDQRVDVLIGRAHGGTVGQPLGDAVQALEQLRLFGGREHTHPAKGVDPGLARGHVLGPDAVIDGETAVQRIEGFARSQGEAPAPHLVRRGFRRLVRHQSATAPASRWRAASSPAPIFSASPYRWMKPSASFWL